MNNNPWTTPYWCKPFGAASEKREQLAVAGTLADKAKMFGKDLQRIKIDLLRPFERRSSGHGVPGEFFGRTRQAELQIKTFAHDRICLSSYLAAPKYRGKRCTVGALRRGIAGAGLLELPRETRRALKIGGRWRNLPLKSRYTSNGRNWVRDVAHISEHDTEGAGCFLTLTLPGGTPQAFEVMSIASGYIVDRFNRWLRYKASGSIFSYVWELQKRGAPHLHYVFRTADGTSPRAFAMRAKAEWCKILEDVSNDSGIDLFARKSGGTHRHNYRHVQVVGKELSGTYARYISKYMSKVQSKSGGVNRWCPGRWWGVSYAGRKEALKRRLNTVLPQSCEEQGVEALISLSEILAPLAVSSRAFKRIPNGAFDSISIQLPPGVILHVHDCVAHYFEFGDLTPLQELLERSVDCIKAAQLERKRLHEYSSNTKRGIPDGETFP